MRLKKCKYLQKGCPEALSKQTSRNVCERFSEPSPVIFPKCESRRPSMRRKTSKL